MAMNVNIQVLTVISADHLAQNFYRGGHLLFTNLLILLFLGGCLQKIHLILDITDQHYLKFDMYKNDVPFAPPVDPKIVLPT